MVHRDATDDEKFHDECAVIGVINHPEAAKYCYLGLYAMQHRGQEGAGIVSVGNGEMCVHRDVGLVADVFSPDELDMLLGPAAVGHNRYATHGTKDRENLQPFLANFSGSSYAIAHNGNLVNADHVRSELERNGAIFSTTSDTEVILHLIARANRSSSVSEKISQALRKVRGAYSLVVLTPEKMFAIRGPSGVRPLSLAKIGDGYVIASETCAFDLIGADFVRDIEPGEILEVTRAGKLSSHFTLEKDRTALCVFEYIYFARPDSNIDGKNVYSARKALGAQLAREHPADADLVVPVPDSGVPSAIGYAQEMGLPLEFGLIRNHYVGRTFIEPRQSIRDFGVKVKLNANAPLLAGKRVAVVDDSIVRGTTCKKIVKILRQAGAKEIHFRISSPPTTGPCYYGIDTPSREELIGASHSVDEIKKFIAADSLGYLSVEGLYAALKSPQEQYCDACFTGNYCLGTPADDANAAAEQSAAGSRPAQGK